MPLFEGLSLLARILSCIPVHKKRMGHWSFGSWWHKVGKTSFGNAVHFLTSQGVPLAKNTTRSLSWLLTSPSQHITQSGILSKGFMCVSSKQLQKAPPDQKFTSCSLEPWVWGTGAEAVPQSSLAKVHPLLSVLSSGFLGTIFLEEYLLHVGHAHATSLISQSSPFSPTVMPMACT